MKDGRPKLGKNDARKSKKINIDNLKDKAISIKDKTRDKTKVKIKDKSTDSFKKDIPPKLGKTDHKNVLTSFSEKFRNIPWINSRRSVLVLILIIFIGAAGVLAVNNPQTPANKTNNTTVTPTVNQNHFNNGLISFDYPKGWNVTNGTKAPLIVTVSKDENNSFSVMNEDLKKTNFAERVLLWRQNILQSGDITYENNITIDNSSGYNIEAIYKINNTNYNVRGVAISKNNTIYFVMFIFNKSLLDYKDEMDLVINSFHVIH